MGNTILGGMKESKSGLVDTLNKIGKAAIPGYTHYVTYQDIKRAKGDGVHHSVDLQAFMYLGATCLEAAKVYAEWQFVAKPFYELARSLF